MLSRREALKAFAGCLAFLGLPVGQTLKNDTVPVLLTNESMIPEMWARESLAILEENMVVASLVHRDFERPIMNANARLKRKHRTT